MPGKVNPTQCEAVTMVAVQVMGNDAAIGFAGSQGNFELNVFKPVMIFNFLHSVELLTDACNSFVEHCMSGIEARPRQDRPLREELADAGDRARPKIGYDNAAKVAKPRTTATGPCAKPPSTRRPDPPKTSTPSSNPKT